MLCSTARNSVFDSRRTVDWCVGVVSFLDKPSFTCENDDYRYRVELGWT